VGWEKMKKIMIYAFVLVLMAGFVGANGGAIWTTRGDCGDETQDVNHFSTGDHVYINGKGFSSSTQYNWSIKGQPGGASCDPGVDVALGDHTTDGNGNFCFKAYTIQADDCGEYKVTFGNKGDNYRVGQTVPEFASFTVALAILLTTPAFAYLIIKKQH
ncbi:MAG: hypothetical protein KAU03_03500, partial [Candidatus Altiarchaeales archaeon]|nr:hypothetical protein [Candidatus Altiarchaeales archaeon]